VTEVIAVAGARSLSSIQIKEPSMAKIPLHPKNPDRICWGCDKFCPAESLACGNGTIRTQHPAELFGEDWLDWAERRDAAEEPSNP
jgi:hypothetical protein